MNRKTLTSADTIVVCLVHFQILLFFKLSTLSLDRLTVNGSESPFVDDIFGGGRFRRSHALSVFVFLFQYPLDILMVSNQLVTQYRETISICYSA